jgi:hypothetical protein
VWIKCGKGLHRQCFAWGCGLCRAQVY